jgi:ribonuclease HI
MKVLKFEHHLADLVRKGAKTCTWRIYDDKNISVDDEITAIDKVNVKQPNTWQVFGTLLVDRVEEKHLKDIDVDDFEGHEKFFSTSELVATYKQYYGPEVGLDTPIKIIHFKYVPEQGKNDKKVVRDTTKLAEAKVYADGGSRGNPGPSASGYVITDMDGNVVVRKSVYLGITTNNQAEYRALLYALEAARDLGVERAGVFMDSMLVINQMNGIFKVKNRDLWPIHESIKKLASTFREITFSHIPRELNKLADAEVNKALDLAEQH